tara:strand:- start:500 stop:2536 length:2037 start_codon:yes stop_codon:yes gene_type:complete
VAFVLNDRVKETTTTTGTGTINLAGAATGFETFVAGVGNSNVTYYCIAGRGTTEFEVGIGTVTDASPDTLSRTTILSSSNSDSAVDFSAGTKDVFCTLPAGKTIREVDTALNVPTGTTAQRASSPAAGDFRYNTTTGRFEGYLGSAWGSFGSSNSFFTNIFAGDGSDTTFTLSQTIDNENDLLVFIDGVFQAQNVYSVSGTTLTFATAPANGRVITVYSVKAGVSGSNYTLSTMTGDGSDTTLTLNTDPVNENNVQVYIDGTYQNKDTFSVSGTTLTFSEAPPNNTKVEAIVATQTTINTATQLLDADGDTKVMVEESSDEDKIRFDTGGTERMIIDDGGIVGIGTSSPTSYANSQKTLVIEDSGSPAIAWSDTGQSKDWFAVAQGSGLYFNYADGGGSSGASNVTDVLYLDNSGNVGLSSTTAKKFVVNQTSTSGYFLSGEASGTEIAYWYYDANQVQFASKRSNSYMAFLTEDTERMRIGTNGQVSIGIQGSGEKFYVFGNDAGSYLSLFYHDGNDNDRYGIRIVTGDDDATTGQFWLRFDDGNGHAQGYIYHNNGTVEINQASDERLKENIVDSTLEGINTLKNIKQREFNWKRDVNKTKVIGYIAQELESVYPIAIVTNADKSGDGVVAPEDDPDNPYKYLAKERLIDVLIKATQEQQVIIEDLKTRIETLEGS